MMASVSNSFPRQTALFVLASALCVPAFAQQAQPVAEPQPVSSSAAPTQPPAAPSASVQAPKEGFWGRVNPFARKKWVDKRLTPLKDQLTELDEVNARNARDIQDVDSRAQAGIRHAQSTADQAGQAADAAGAQARKAGDLAQNASSHVDQIGSTVSGLDQYRQTHEIDVEFRGGQPILSPAARKLLDELAASVTGRQGYILELEAHAPAAGGAGIQNSERLAEAVKRYLVTDHEIPVYRLHAVALGNAPAGGQEGIKPVRASSVHIRLMENSLAAQGTASPHEAASLNGAERP